MDGFQGSAEHSDALVILLSALLLVALILKKKVFSGSEVIVRAGELPSHTAALLNLFTAGRRTVLGSLPS